MTPQRMPPELLAITPPTQAMSVDAGSGPSRKPCGASTRLTWPSTVPGRTRARRAVVLDRDPAEVAADIDQDPVALALAVEAGAAGAEGDRDRVTAPVLEQLRDVVGVASHHHGLRDQPVGAGVGGVADQVGGPRRAPGRPRPGRRVRRAAAAGCHRRPRRGRRRGSARPAPAPAARSSARADPPTPKTATSRALPRPRPAAGRRRRSHARARPRAHRRCSPWSR